MHVHHINTLYQQNLELGYQINALTDENNFYRIQINNIKKLKQAINKDLNKSSHQLQHSFKFPKQLQNIKALIETDMGINRNRNSYYQQAITEKNTIQPLLKVNTKIKLKNLQMKVGNEIRQTEKVKKVFQGSLSTLMKKAAVIEHQVTLLAREYQQIIIENQLLSNIYLADHYESLHQEIKDKNYYDDTKDITHLEEKQIEYVNKLELLRKQEKNYKKIKEDIISQISQLQKEIESIKQSDPEGAHFSILKSNEVKQLLRLEKEEQTITQLIKNQDETLQHQHKLNQDLIQKNNDRKQQQLKEFKLLREQIDKLNEQINDIDVKQKDRKNNKQKKI